MRQVIVVVVVVIIVTSRLSGEATALAKLLWVRHLLTPGFSWPILARHFCKILIVKLIMLITDGFENIKQLFPTFNYEGFTS